MKRIILLTYILMSSATSASESNRKYGNFMFWDYNRKAVCRTALSLDSINDKAELEITYTKFKIPSDSNFAEGLTLGVKVKKSLPFLELARVEMTYETDLVQRRNVLYFVQQVGFDKTHNINADTLKPKSYIFYEHLLASRNLSVDFEIYGTRTSVIGPLAFSASFEFETDGIKHEIERLKRIVNKCYVENF